MGILLWMVGALVVAIFVALLVDHHRGPFKTIDHAGSPTANLSGKGRGSFTWPAGRSHGGDT